MSGASASAVKPRAKPNARVIAGFAAIVILLAAMAFSTRVVRTGSGAAAPAGSFAAATYGTTEFPKVRSAIVGRAVVAAVLASALAKDPAAAAKRYGVATGAGPEFAVTFDGVVEKGDFGTYAVAVPGLPKGVAVAVQTGPVILGTDLRDAAGTISFGQFANQIEYQNAGAALNSEMKKQVLAKIDAGKLTGKTISVVGAFQLNDPKLWTVTPVKFEVR